MLVIRVELLSAVHHSRDKEIARLVIANVGGDDKRGDYKAVSYRGRGKKALDGSMRRAELDETKPGITRSGEVKGYPRKTKHVLNLVVRALLAMGYK